MPSLTHNLAFVSVYRRVNRTASERVALLPVAESPQQDAAAALTSPWLLRLAFFAWYLGFAWATLLVTALGLIPSLALLDARRILIIQFRPDFVVHVSHP